TGPSDWQVTPRVRRQGSSAELSYQLDEGRRGVPPWLGGIGSTPELAVQVNPSLPLTVDARAGVTEANLDLQSLKVSRLDLDAGASHAVVRLPAAGMSTARIRGGASRLELEVPSGVAAQVRYQGGLSALEIDESRFPAV